MNVCGGSSGTVNENSVPLGSLRGRRGGSGGASGELPVAAIGTGRAIAVAVFTACLGDAMAGGEDGGGDRW